MPKRSHQDYLNLMRSEAQNHFRTQQSIAKTQIAKAGKPNRFKIFLTTNIFGWFFHYIKSRFGKKHPFVDYSGSATNGVFEMYSSSTNDKNKIKIVIAADWATDTKESDHIAHMMRDENSDYSIHLGDTYFVGAPIEIESNFTAPGASWPRGSSGTLAIPGNHEFYSNGNPYYNELLPEMFAKTPNGVAKQDASFFCLQNDYWIVLGLDTGYYSVGKIIIELFFRPDAHLGEKTIEWLKREVQPEKNNKGIVILTHHQYCSAFESQFVNAGEALREIIGDDREVIWLWGHEHRLAVYGKFQSKDGIKAFGRCIGHGGMPVEVGNIKGGDASFNDPDPDRAKEYNLVFFDKRIKTNIGNMLIGHNGFAVLNFEDNKLSIEYKDESTWLYKEEWEVDFSGAIKGKAINNPVIDLKLVSGSFDDATH